MKKLVIDPDLCIGCGSCVALAPNTLVLDNNTAKAKVLDKIGDTEENVKNAIDCCSVQAIFWKS